MHVKFDVDPTSIYFILEHSLRGVAFFTLHVITWFYIYPVLYIFNNFCINNPIP